MLVKCVEMSSLLWKVTPSTLYSLLFLIVTLDMRSVWASSSKPKSITEHLSLVIRKSANLKTGVTRKQSMPNIPRNHNDP